MAVEISLIVKPYGLVPATEMDHDAAKSLRLDSIVRATITKPRSNPMLNLYWATIQKVSKGIGYDKQALSDDLLVSTKRVKMYVLSNGWTRVYPVGISSMDGYELRDYVDDAFHLIMRDYLPGITKEELLSDVERMLGISYETERNKLDGKPRKG